MPRPLGISGLALACAAHASSPPESAKADFALLLQRFQPPVLSRARVANTFPAMITDDP